MRQRMVIENLSPRTIQSYLHGPRQLINYWDRHPKDIGKDMIYDFLVYLKEDRQLSRSSMRITVSGIKYLYKHFLNCTEIADKIPFPKVERHLPVILSIKELKTIFDQTLNLKYRVILKLIYSCGLRRGEAQKLKLSDIDYLNMKMLIRQGKGRKDRYIILSHHIIGELKSYCDEYDPCDYLFYGRDKETMISDRSMNWMLKNATKRAGISKSVSITTLRHSFACHHLMLGTNLFVIQQLLGHANINSTIIYLQITNQIEATVANPLDIMYLKSEINK